MASNVAVDENQTLPRDAWEHATHLVFLELLFITCLTQLQLPKPRGFDKISVR